MKTFVPLHSARIYLMATHSQNTVILLAAVCRIVLVQRLDTGAVVSKLLESCTKGKEKYQGNFIQSKAKYNSNMLSRVTVGHTSRVTQMPSFYAGSRDRRVLLLREIAQEVICFD